MCIRMEMGNVQNGVGNELRKKGRGGERGGEERDTTRKNKVGEINTGDFVFVFVKFY